MAGDRSPQTATRGGRRARFDRASVLQTALKLVDRDGAEALSMRRLGHELGIEAMSLYTYIGGREELLDGLSEQMVQALPRTPAPNDWRDAVRAFAHAIRDVARNHPQAFILVGMRPLRTERALAPIETLLGSLRSAGFSPTAAVAAYRLTAAYARGFALAEIQGFTLDTDPQPTQQHTAETHPWINEARATPRALDHETAFTRGLDTIIVGLALRSCAEPGSP